MRLAGASDDPALREILAEDGFGGRIRVCALREPSPLASFQREGHEALIFLLEDLEEGRVVGMGGVVCRDIALDGRRQTLGYLCGLRIRAEARGRFRHLGRVYRELRRLTADRVDLYLSAILAENPRALRLLTGARAGLPRYHPLGGYLTFFLPTGGRGPGPSLKEWSDPSLYEALRSRMDGMRWEPRSCGLEEACWVETEGGLGYLAVPGHKQYRVLSYGGWMRLASWIPPWLTGYPRLPRAGHLARYATGAIFSPDPDQARRILRELRRRARGLDFLMIGCMQDDPLARILAEERHVLYRSRLFEVLFPGMEPHMAGPLQVEVALL